MLPPENRISRQDFTKPYHPEQDVIIEPEIRMSTNAFPIDKADYFLLTKLTTGLSGVANNFLLLSAGIAGPLGARWYLASQSNIESDIKPWEWTTLFLFLGVGVVLHVLGYCLPNERRSLLKRMKAFFNNATTRVESRRRA